MSAAVTHAALFSDYAGQAVVAITKSKLALSGAALALAGFFGIFGVVSLTPQNAIISGYVCFFGFVLIVFALSPNNEVLAKYFGFMFRPNGQLYFLFLAGNLAWTTGWLGVLAAIFTNFVVCASWSSANQDNPVAAYMPSWMKRADPGPTASATGMVDIHADEML